MPDTNLGTATGYLNLDIHNWNNALDDARESLREFENSSNSMGDTLRNTQQASLVLLLKIGRASCWD